MRKVVFWDFDETLGCFRGRENPVFKPGIRVLLESLVAAGFENYVASRSWDSYVKGGLCDGSIDALFKGVFCSGVYGFATYYSKNYLPLAAEAGLSEDELNSRVIVVGNDVSDIPGDSGPIFVFHPECYRADSEILNRIVRRICARDDFRDSFGDMMDSCFQVDGAVLTYQYSCPRYVPVISVNAKELLLPDALAPEEKVRPNL